ncbi:hypothetical protein J5X84_33475 [Streptosporangiaceae bacterium NEAU-GS5]|nr:hypothetical protein [Streptosporangiaceae bacterium NEAU-GS5]
MTVLHKIRAASLGAGAVILAVSTTALSGPVWAQPNTPMAEEIQVQSPGRIVETIRMASRNPSGGLDFFWAVNGGGWSTRRVTTGPVTSDPAIAPGNGSVRIAAAGASNTLDFYWQNNGDSGWHKQTLGGAGTAASAPTMTRGDDNTTLIATRQSDNSLWFRWNRDTSPSWPAIQVDGPGAILSSPAIAHSDSAVGMAAQGPNNSLNFYWQNDGDAGWHKVVVVGSGATSTTPAILRSSNTFLKLGSTTIVVRTPNGGLDLYRNYHGDPNWFKNGGVAADGTAFSEPAIASNDDDSEVHIAVQGPNNSLLFFWTSDSAGPWNQVQVAGPGTTFTAPSIVRGVSSSTISARDAAGRVIVYRNSDGSSGWSRTVVG